MRERGGSTGVQGHPSGSEPVSLWPDSEGPRRGDSRGAALGISRHTCHGTDERCHGAFEAFSVQQF